MNNMTWNQSKFQILRLGLNNDLKNETIYLAPDGKKVIETKNVVKDLGVMVDDQLSYNQHRQKAIKKTVQKLGWVKRTFANRTIPFLKVIWNSILQPHQDYGSILTAPYQKCERKASEHPLRVLTKLPSECKKCHYWDRLQKFRLYSNE